MINVLDYYVVDFNLNEAIRIVEGRGAGDLLAGMESIQKVWSDYVKATHTGETPFETDDDFFDAWGYECSAYNVVFENMAKLFAAKETV